ncbi:MAG: hypothetical protein KDD70_16665 [Bdellovibrionales bacterium]|nr:hypothetical protein [Bdellovibrionales bacterium]
MRDASIVPVRTSREFSLYEIVPQTGEKVTRYVVSTPETRAICNDPMIVGVRYTEMLKEACVKAFISLKEHSPVQLVEEESVVLHLLRGGLNFGLREALQKSFGWNNHSSSFISAQRARKSDDPEEWHITEATYQKLYLPKRSTIFFGDVVATGTSLQFALERLLAQVESRGDELRNIIFFTIGGARSEEILKIVDKKCREIFPGYEHSVVLYFEGRFAVASAASQLRIKHTGTDLLRTNSALAPEFVESQYENPTYPLERCTIYDAGSRAFWLPDYLQDVRDYWQNTSELVKSGVDFEELLRERMPELDASRFGSVNLEQVVQDHLQKLAL